MKHNQTRLIKLLIALLAVFSLLILKNELSRFLPQKLNQPFSSLNREQIREVVLTKDKTTSFYRKDKLWYVKKDNNEFRADGDRINKIVDSFFDLKKEEIVSNNKNKHKELGIARQKIEIKTNDKSYVIFIGNTTGLSKNYVRIGDENDVYIAGGFEDAFTSDDYRDLLVHLINDEAKITSIEINFDDKKTILVKKGNNWKTGDKSAKKDRVDFFLNDLKTLKAKDVLNKQQNYPDVNAALSIFIKENGKEKNINFYPQNEEEHFVRIFPSDFDYLIAVAYVASLKKEEKDFLE